jgi:hypothetical protein
MTIETTARNATLADLADLLKRQQDVKLDAVVPATAIRSLGGVLYVRGLTVMEDSLDLRPTEICDGHIADKLGIPVAYLRRMRTERPDLYDVNLNGWLHGTAGTGLDGYNADEIVQPDPRSFLLRAFSDPDGGEGIARALHSDRYGIVDNLDVLLAALAGVKESGVETEIVSADLSERRMVVRFAAPSVAALAPTLLRGYRSPFTGAEGAENPTVFAGFELSNSETGGGAFSIVPRLIVEVCTNGMKLTKDAFRKIHLGSQMEDGIVRYSDDTRRKSIELVSAQTRDAVATFLDMDYVEGAIVRLEQNAGVVIADPIAAFARLAKQQNFTADEQALILSHFISGALATAGGVLHAITSAAQVVGDPDRAYELEGGAVAAMEALAAV